MSTRERVAAAAARHGWAPSPHEFPGELGDEYYRGDAKIAVHFTRAGGVHWAHVRNSAGDLVATIYRGVDRLERVLAEFARTDLGPVPACTALEAGAYFHGWALENRPNSCYAIWRRGEEVIEVTYSSHGVDLLAATREIRGTRVGRALDSIEGTKLGRVLDWFSRPAAVPS